MTALDTALQYIRRGWNPVPIPHRKKGPIGDAWQRRLIRESDAPQFFNGKPQNVGVILGPSSNGLTDTDLDCLEAIDLAPYLLPNTQAVFGRRSKPDSHWLYRTTLGETSDTAVLPFRHPETKEVLVELRVGGAKGAQTVFPGSTHESGEVIEWANAGVPAAVDGVELRRRVAALAAAVLFVRAWPGEGARHDAARALGGFLARAGWTLDEVKSFVQAVATVAGDPEVEDRQKAAGDQADAYARGRRSYGLPKLKEMFGDAVAVRVADWLGYSEREEPQAKAPRIRTAFELERMTFAPLKYVVVPYIVEGLTLFVGNPKLGKSWFCLDAGLAVARGTACFGGSACEQGDVLYLALEDNERRLQSRMTQLLDFEEWPSAFSYATEWPRADEGGIEHIRAWVGRVAKPRLVIIDVHTQFRSARGDRESLYESDYRSLKALQSLAAELQIAIVVVHHTRKGREESDPFERVSGTMGLSGAADCVLILSKDAGTTTLYGRGRDTEELEVAFEFDKCRWRALGEAAEVRRSDERSIILETLKEAGEPLTPNVTAVTAGMKGGNVRRLLSKMVMDGEIKRVGRGKYVHPSVTAAESLSLGNTGNNPCEIRISTDQGGNKSGNEYLFPGNDPSFDDLGDL